MGSNLTETSVERMKADDRPYEVRDGRLKGFLVRVQPTGAKTFYCEYGRGKREKLGRFGIMGTHEARTAAAKLLRQRDCGEDPSAARVVPKSTPTLGEFVSEHYEPWVRENHHAADATLYRLRSTLSSFRDLKLDKIDVGEIEKWRTQRLRSGISAATVDRDINVLRGAITRAGEWGAMPKGTLENLKQLNAADEGSPRYFSDDEEKRLRAALKAREEQMRKRRESGNEWRLERDYECKPDLRALPFADRLKPMVILSMHTGLRRGEMFKLPWREVNLEQKVLTVRSLSSKAKRRRDIYLNSEAIEILTSWRKMTDRGAELVFPGANGKELTDLKRSWGKLLKDAEISDFRWHDLRHHFASKLAMAGVDLNTIRELLGHSDYKMTLRYAHLAPNHKRKAVDMLCAA